MTISTAKTPQQSSRPRCRNSSVDEFQPELDLPGKLSRKNSAELRRIHIPIGKIKVRMIGQIKELGPKLDVLCLADTAVFHERKIRIVEARPNKSVPTNVSESASRWDSERRRIEPSIRRTLSRG
jgi:hypothetical protein